jgi:hypothetical protein
MIEDQQDKRLEEMAREFLHRQSRAAVGCSDQPILIDLLRQVQREERERLRSLTREAADALERCSTQRQAAEARLREVEVDRDEQHTQLLLVKADKLLAEAKLEKVEAALRGDGVVNWQADGLVLPCGRCGAVVPFGFTVRDEAWKERVPEEWRLGVLCLPCLDSCAALPLRLEDIQVVYFTGRAGTIPLIPALRDTAPAAQLLVKEILHVKPPTWRDRLEKFKVVLRKRS